MLTVIAIIPIKPAHFDEAAAVVAKNLAAIRREEGCISYTAAQASDGSGRLFTFERWIDDAALAAHLANAETKAMLAAIAPRAAGEPEIVKSHEIEG